MSVELTRDSLPCELSSSEAYNQLQLRRVMDSRYEPITESSAGSSADLLRVLVVDDHQDGANILSVLIKVWGHDCRRANDGATGLALAAEFQPDVVLVDILMPTMSGIEFAVLMRQQARFQNSLIVVVSGCTDAVHRLQSEQAGVNLYLIKPASPAILQKLLTMEATYLTQSQENIAISTGVAPTLPEPKESMSRIFSQLTRRIPQLTLTTSKSF